MCGREKEQLVIQNMLNYLSNMVETKFVLWQREPSYTTQIQRNAAKLIGPWVPDFSQSLTTNGCQSSAS